MQTEKVIKRDKKYVLHTYARSQVVLAEGHGMTAADPEGKRYLDFTSGIGVNSLGYCHPAWVQAVCDQAATLQHTSNLYYTAPCGKLAKKLCRRTGMDAVFFGNSGAEANEGAIKAARKYSTDTYGAARNKVITLVNSFHGRTLATLTATGQDVFHQYFGPFPGNFAYVPAGDFSALRDAADDTVCAVMLELVQGEGGVVALDADYVAKVAEFCKKRDLVLIVDEVQTGVGRTGKFLACEHFDLHPDIVTLAKGLGGGAVVGRAGHRHRHAHGQAAHDHAVGHVVAITNEPGAQPGQPALAFPHGHQVGQDLQRVGIIRHAGDHRHAAVLGHGVQRGLLVGAADDGIIVPAQGAGGVLHRLAAGGLQVVGAQVGAQAAHLVDTHL